MNAYKLQLIECFDFTGYDVQPLTDSLGDKVAAAYSIFLSEMGWQLQAPHNKPLAVVCADWLAGLASACTVRYYNGDILDWAFTTGLLAKNASEDKQDDFLADYFSVMGSNLASMFQRSAKGYKIV